MRRMILKRILHPGSYSTFRWLALPLLTGTAGLVEVSCGHRPPADGPSSVAVQPLVAQTASKSAACPWTHPIWDGTACRESSVCSAHSATAGYLPSGAGFDSNVGYSCLIPWPLATNDPMASVPGPWDVLPSSTAQNICSCGYDGYDYCNYLDGAPCNGNPRNPANITGTWKGYSGGAPK